MHLTPGSDEQSLKDNNTEGILLKGFPHLLQMHHHLFKGFRLMLSPFTYPIIYRPQDHIPFMFRKKFQNLC